MYHQTDLFEEILFGLVGCNKNRKLKILTDTNLIYWRPPGNRNPTPVEIASCLPFLERQVEILAPRLLLLVGGMSAKTLLHRSEGILKLRGRWADYHHPRLGQPIPALPTLHPAYLLRQPAQKREAWRDLLSLAEAMEREGLMTPAAPKGVD